MMTRVRLSMFILTYVGYVAYLETIVVLGVNDFAHKSSRLTMCFDIKGVYKKK